MPSHRIGKAPFHPIGYQGRGGTILQWTLGFNRYAHQIALQKGHQELFDFLIAESDVTTRFLVACVMADRPAAEAIIASSPGLVAKLPDADLELLARYCWETNMSVEAVRSCSTWVFRSSFPSDLTGFRHCTTPHGAVMVNSLSSWFSAGTRSPCAIRTLTELRSTGPSIAPFATVVTRMANTAASPVH